MGTRIRNHVRSNVVGYIAIFLFAMSGTAIALDGSNTVFSDDIVDGEVKSVDIGNKQVLSADVRDNSLTGTDIADTSLTGADIAADSLSGANLDEASVNLISNSNTGSCNDDSDAGSVCSSTSIVLGEAGRILATATGAWHTVLLDDPFGPNSGSDDTQGVSGRCWLRVDGVQLGTQTTMGERSSTIIAHPTGKDGTMALTGRSGPLGAGTHTVDAFCQEDDGDLDWSFINLTAQGLPG